MANEPKRKAKPEIVELGQGKRLLEYMALKKIKSRSELARLIGVSSSSINEVIWNYKAIKENLQSKIQVVFPDLDMEWLLTGNKSGSIHIKPIEQEEKGQSTTEEIKTEEGFYLLCKEKERYIKALEERIEELKKTISFQEECIRGFKSYFPGEKNTG